MSVVPCCLGFAARCFRIVLPLILAVVAAIWLWWPAGVVLGLGALYLLSVHRCPDLHCTRIPGAIAAPCDGTATVGQYPDSRMRWIRLKPAGLDCRILRAPISGRVTRADPAPGGQQIEIEGEHVIVRVSIEGGYRFLGWPSRLQKGTDLDAGEAVGLVPFGGRVVVEFPDCASAKIFNGQKANGGKTIVAIAFEDDLRKGRVISRSDSDLVSLAETG